MEQAALCFLKRGRSPPMVKKYAFHLVLAAHQYKEAALMNHAIRCYSTAVRVYAHRNWLHIEDHINFNLGNLSWKADRYEAAIEYFLELLGSSRGTEKRTKNFFDRFLAIVKKWPNTNSQAAKRVF